MFQKIRAFQEAAGYNHGIEIQWGFFAHMTLCEHAYGASPSIPCLTRRLLEL